MTDHADPEAATHRRSKSHGSSTDPTLFGAIRKSISIIKLPEPKPVDPMQEPRRSISKRPLELHLAEQDPHYHHRRRSQQAEDPEKQTPPRAQQQSRRRGSGSKRTIPFAAPYARSGVVLETPATLRDWLIPGPLTFGYGQWWYLVFAQSFIAAIISGSINFGVAVALYRPQHTVAIWPFDRQTVAGDMGVTVIIQQVVSFIITSTLVHHDLYAGPIGPLRRPWPPLLHLPSTPTPEGHWLGVRLPRKDDDLDHTGNDDGNDHDDYVVQGKPLYMGRSEGRSRLNGWWWWFVRAVLTGSERNDLLAAGISWRQRMQRLVWTAAQGFFLCCLTFWWYWPLAIAIVAPIYEHRELAHTWIPMIIKLLYGGIMSLLTNPIMALMAMGAESSVRRCYPELDMWVPFGGQDDFERWKVEQGITAGEGSEAGAAVDAADVEGAEEEADTSLGETGMNDSPTSSDSSQRGAAEPNDTAVEPAPPLPSAGVRSLGEVDVQQRSIAEEPATAAPAAGTETDQQTHT